MTATNIDAYKALLAEVLARPSVPSVRSTRSVGSGWGRGDRGFREAIGRTLALDAPDVWLAAPSRPLNEPYALVSSVWILLGRDDVGSLSMVNARGDDFADAEGRLCAAFGHRLRAGTDQLDAMVDMLRADPTSRRALALIGRVEDLRDDPRDFPCATSVHAMVRADGLHLVVSMRSQSLLGVLPYDVVNFGYVGDHLAQQLDVPFARVHLLFGSVHVYDHEVEAARRLLEDPDATFVAPPPLPVTGLAAIFDRMLASDLTAAGVRQAIG